MKTVVCMIPIDFQRDKIENMTTEQADINGVKAEIKRSLKDPDFTEISCCEIGEFNH